LIKYFPKLLEDKLLNSNVSRTFYAQKLLPGAGAKLEMFDKNAQDNNKAAAAPAVAPKDFVRTSAADQKMDRFLVKSSSGTAGEPDKKAQPEQVAGSSGANANQECQLTSVKTLRQQLQVSFQNKQQKFSNTVLLFFVSYSKCIAFFQVASASFYVRTPSY
jgi:hypothetical protein